MKYDILIAEDDDSIRCLLEEIIGQLGLTFITARNGVQAIELLKQNEIEILVTDFQMPELDGIELVEWCRQQRLHFPVIFVSANSHLIPREKVALDDCCASVLAKPINIERLEGAILATRSREHHRDCVHQQP